MAKPFYSMEEVSELLGKTPNEIKTLVRAGTLREFRDAGKIFFKAEDVEKLTGGPIPSSEDTSDIMLEPAEEPPVTPEGKMPSISSGGTSVIGLEPIEEEPEEKEDTVITASGIGVFDDDELEIDADPMAKTQITTSAIDDQVSLESSGSGSGLLDLTRESDDTSLGAAELLDEIYPGEEEAAEEETKEEADTQAEEEPQDEFEQADAGEALAPVFAPTGDPSESIFSGLLVGALILLAVAGSVVGGVLQNYLPDYARLLSDNFFFFLGGAAVVVILSVLIGWFVGRAMTPRRG
ncbi:MAG: hypothetical protein ABIG44_03255 [Planctomycetota bacterium]